MIDEARLGDLLLTWEERFEQGDDLLAEKLCPDHPEMAEILAQQISKLKKARWVTRRIAPQKAANGGWQVPLLTSSVNRPVIAGQYRIDQLIAEGGFGQVWRGFDLSLERPVAIKVPRNNRLTDAGRVERFLAEARRVARLRHPNIVPVYNVVRHDGVYFIVMDLIEGIDLRHRMKQGMLPVREVVRIVLDVAAAVDHAHRQGVIHRDIKPANILLENNRSVFVTDFGIASTTEDVPEKEIYGTLAYMSPEQVRGAKCDARSDVYSLGSVLLELLTGNPPSPTNAQNTLLEKESPRNENLLENFDKYEMPHKNAATAKAQNEFFLPPTLMAICQKCLAVNPNHRFGSAREMADALRSVVSGIVTESDWLSCTDSSRMLAHLFGLHASPRKLRLFACACVGPDFYGLLEKSRNAVLVAEKFADGQATAGELNEAADEAWEATNDSLADPVFAAAYCAEVKASRAAAKTAKYVSSAIQCNVLQDIFGPTPFRSPNIDPSWLSWRDGVIVRLAEKVYRASSPPRTYHIGDIMKVIGEYLHQAGCTDQELLAHCRSSNRHNKGCWVIDLILGKQ